MIDELSDDELAEDLKAAADAHKRRQASPLWAPSATTEETQTYANKLAEEGFADLEEREASKQQKPVRKKIAVSPKPLSQPEPVGFTLLEPATNQEHLKIGSGPPERAREIIPGHLLEQFKSDIIRSSSEALARKTTELKEDILNALKREVSQLKEAHLTQPSDSSCPQWLINAASIPRTYDAPDSDRRTACIRITPTLQKKVQQTQSRMGLRTLAGAYEYLLRLGVSSAEHLP